MKKIPLHWLLIILVCLVALDQASKWYVVMNFDWPVIGRLDTVPVFHTELLNLDIIRIHNTGVAFGFGNNTQWAPMLFLGVQVVALVWLVWLYRRRYFNTRLMQISWALVLAGVLGNMADRLLQGFYHPMAVAWGFFEKLSNGYVVDFIDFSFPWLSNERFVYGCYHWPAFNIADACVCTAAALFLIASFTHTEPTEKQKKEAEQKPLA